MPDGTSAAKVGVDTDVKHDRLAREDHEYNGHSDGSPGASPSQRTNAGERSKKRGIPTSLGVVLAAFVLLASAGGTYFFFTSPPEYERLLAEGHKQLSAGQYAFALKSLLGASQIKPDDPRVLLALARAYVGVDQTEKAWNCISQAQQLGAGVTADPELAADLSNYYRQHNQYQRSVELLRQITEKYPHKRAELADLDAAWGDESLHDGNYRQALMCWQEVKEIGEGSRFAEADTRLATIYQKMADDMNAKGDTDEALKYYSRLNALAPTAGSLEKTADLFQKEGKLDLAIDQMRNSVKLSADTNSANRKLASLMVLRGKELLDSGDSDTGYGYLQQAQALDPHIKPPGATIRNSHLESDIAGTGNITFSGEIWNPGPNNINSLVIKGEIYDTKAGKPVWSKDQRLIDEFVPPLAVHDSKQFQIAANGISGDVEAPELRIFINGGLYKSYRLAGKSKTSAATRVVPGGDNPTGETSSVNPPAAASPGHSDNSTDTATAGNPLSPVTPKVPALRPPIGSSAVKNERMPAPAPNIVPPYAVPPPRASGPAQAPGLTPEEKTLKDLE